MGIYITSSGAADIAADATGILIQVNKALTGTITCQAGGTTFTVITDPTVGSQFVYGGLHGKGKITVNPSATTDIYVSILNRPL